MRSEPGIKEQLSYAGGEFASNFAWNMVAGFLLFYYTDIALLPVAALGALMLASRVLDAVADPLVGMLVDRTRTRWGQARPYMLFAAIPFGILCVLTFAVPVSWSPTAKVIYGATTFTLLGLLYSLVYIPFGALQPMMVREPAIKARLGGWRAMATSIASIVVYSIVMPTVSLAGPDHKPLGFLLAAAVVAAITVALYLNTFFQCHERFVSTPSASRSVARDLQRMFRNPVWWSTFAYVLVTFTRIGVLVSSAAYFANNVLKNPAMLSVMLPLLSVSILIGGFLASIIMKRIGVRLSNAIVLCLALLLFVLMPQLEGNNALWLAAFMGANVGGGIIAATVFVSVADSVEYNEARFGEPNEGLLFAGVSFGMKVGMAFGAAGAAFALSAAGYDPKAVSADAVEMIRTLFYRVQIALIIVQLLCLLFFKPQASATNGGKPLRASTESP